MYTNNMNEQYTIEYTDLFGTIWTDSIKTYTREFARQMVRFIRNNGMFDNGRRAVLSNVRVIKIKGMGE